MAQETSPQRPWELRLARSAAGRAALAYQRGQLADRAAALTYHGMFSLFPSLFVAASIAGLVGGQALVDQAVSWAESAGAGSSGEQVVHDLVQAATGTRDDALGLALAASTAMALVGMSGVFNAAGRALNAVQGVSDDRGFARRRLTSLAIALVVVVTAVLGLAAVFLGEDLSRPLLEDLGLGGDAAGIWRFVRWLVAALAATVGVLLTYRFAPAGGPGARSTLGPGGVTAVALWVLLSAGFAEYLHRVRDFGTLYGVFGAAIVLLLWLNLLASAFLYGAALNAEFERGQAGAGPSAA